ncbi:MAG: response regulator, partial [Desulfobacterales bacterium]|nr:response regulator [Desulfobacterales bacterium]
RGFIWLTTWGAGLLRYNKRTGEKFYYKSDPDRPDSISGNIVLPLRVTRDGRFWVGTGNGLDLFDPKSGRFTGYTRANGHPWDSVHSIGEDARGVLWLGTNAGLARFDPASGKARSYTREDGVQGDMFYPLNGIRTRDGRMWLGGSKGMNSFHPDRIGDNATPPAVRLTSIKQGGEEVDFGKAPERLKEIILDWRSNYFEFEFAAMDYSNPGKNQYSYKLEGLDNDWYLSGTRNFGRYSGIPPGEYTLRLRGSNNDGVWNKEGRALIVRVSPPFWRTGWFYGLLLFLVLGVVAAVFFYMVELRRQINERRRAEARLHESLARVERLNAELKRLDQLKDDFMANTSHELRTPLNGIIGLAEALLEGPGGDMAPSTRGDLKMIISSGRRLANLVNDILDFSKLRHKDLALRKQPVDARSAVELVLALLKPLADGKGLTLANNTPPDAPPVDADEDRLQQILFNLAGNALKFTDRGGVVIDAFALSDKLHIRVKDTGIGIPRDKQARIFESFEQVDGAVSRQYGGTGLGLAVSRQLVELHGGEIRVASRPGEGSTFSFCLPLAAGAPHETAGGSPGRKNAPGVRGLVSRMAASDTVSFRGEEAPDSLAPPPDENAPRILIVDDEPVNLRVISSHLASRGYQVLQASGGREALDLIETGGPFDLVVLDVMMPGMTGYEVCRRLRERFTQGELPVVMLSAKNRVEDLVIGMRAGANDYQAKPFSRSELLARVKTHLSLKEYTDAVTRTQNEMRDLRDYLRNVINSMPSALVSVDENAAATQWNQEAEGLAGEGTDLATGALFVDLFPRFARVGDLISRVVKNGRAETLEKMKVARRGETRFYDATVYPLSVGERPGAVVRLDDVTDRIRIEEMMVQSEKMLSVGGLAAGMAHEINNPLAGILQSLQVVYRRLDADFSKNREVAEKTGVSVEAVGRYMSARGLDKMLGRIKTAGERAAKIVDNMLSFSRKSDASFAPCDLAELLDKTVLLAGHEYDLKKNFDFRKIEITREYAEDLPPAWCDRVKIQQVFFNLLKNGAQAMAEHAAGPGPRDKAGKPKFILRARRSGDNVAVEIEDNGPGMDGATRRRVFEPFFTTKALGVGTGLGLSVSYFIITDDHRGAMSVESTPGRGARFIVGIPMWLPRSSRAEK